MILIAMFSFFAEITFWIEFQSRFNFIAVDYLVYTYEVINNINESYPLPYLISGIVISSLLILLLMIKVKSFDSSFKSHTGIVNRLWHTIFFGTLITLYALFIDNSWAEAGKNRYRDELSKAGIYSFFAAFKNNELNYDQFYTLIRNDKAFSIIRNKLNEPGSQFASSGSSIRRKITTPTPGESTPNVIMIVLESFSADFMKTFGNKQILTPKLDSLAEASILFTNMFATGTRTVRGMEALSLAIPPTPGNSIVRRKENKHLSTIGSIFRGKGYTTQFFYGGDGYFDNMNQYFGNNGFEIIDRGRKLNVGDNYSTSRTKIRNSEVSFENAWGICDEDLYAQVLKDADKKFAKGELFYDFVMTTSNHRPFTFPSGKIDIASGTGREGAVKYTDYAIGSFIEAASKKAWFANTIFVIVADHCANSAGKNEIDISKYHIPAMIYNMPNARAGKVEKMCSQIDLYPTLFSLLNWSYPSNIYGCNVLLKEYSPRILIATYQKLGYMKGDSLVILGPRQKVESSIYDAASNQQKPYKVSPQLIEEAISYYQSAYYLYNNKLLSE
jgi:phosphoglycerol transferase MdoB-like AlkP superfamily enzyme